MIHTYYVVGPGKSKEPGASWSSLLAYGLCSYPYYTMCVYIYVYSLIPDPKSPCVPEQNGIWLSLSTVYAPPQPSRVSGID